MAVTTGKDTWGHTVDFDYLRRLDSCSNSFSALNIFKHGSNLIIIVTESKIDLKVENGEGRALRYKDGIRPLPR